METLYRIAERPIMDENHLKDNISEIAQLAAGRSNLGSIFTCQPQPLSTGACIQSYRAVRFPCLGSDANPISSECHLA